VVSLILDGVSVDFTSVVNYVDAQVGPIAPAIEGRLVFP
jgi:hypothetical protein